MIPLGKSHAACFCCFWLFLMVVFVVVVFLQQNVVCAAAVRDVRANVNPPRFVFFHVKSTANNHSDTPGWPTIDSVTPIDCLRADRQE